MKEYDFYNKRYGIKLQLTLDEEKKELTYKCIDIKDEYRGKFKYESKNGWLITSNNGPAMNHNTRVLLLRGSSVWYDHGAIVINERKYCNYRSRGGNCIYPIRETYKSLQKIYCELVEALDELGNDFSQANAFLDM